MNIKAKFEKEFLHKKAKHAEWRAANKERVRARGRDAAKRWRENNPEVALAKSRKSEEKRKLLHAQGVFVWVGKKRMRGPNWEEYQKQKQRDKYAQDEVYRNKTRKAAKDWIDNNYERWLLRQVKLRAKKSNIPFDLTIDDIVIPKRCPVLGIVLKRGEGHSCDNSPTVDRVDAKGGYIKGNVAIISRKANSLKGFATAAQHRRIAEWMEEFQK